ncbi:alpha-D-ribose 1-methylphosphonate 5-triphosphate diphosphatase [Dyella caseinilytica]|uniref:Alpha-D-ribose 1-methylphosphonate 5-triphosphate diphosphatase n=1 Tax=Dyella caseinilytica TaxID=1849581 RepID=A0ABX7GTN2_9GAMM|nr:alpha-D-ribose 1-methylphosphonate 5-triphosphate diphosphatase [Dyella caseinilytica]QRN53797.1 alpha-D-ribose 1-methylphosphonate 5-triphosphate diphosphatase [Dyella caseinilytica]GFZ89259.1 phosphonate metabolism protein PhnM [Dyella caseinilytica]
MNDLALTNARIVLGDGEIHGSLIARNGIIRLVEEGSTQAPGAIDCEGDYVIPGLIELHTDNLEKHLMPRAGVLWPSLPAVLTHDAQIVAAGITTVFDALSVGDLEEESVRIETLRSTYDSILGGQRSGALRADHWFHLRCELAYPRLIEALEPLMDHASVRLISLMDHTPGQRQYRDLQQYRKYYSKNHMSWGEDEFAEVVKRRTEQQATYSAKHESAVLTLAHGRNIVLASHDDTDTGQVEHAKRIGVTISEFPTTQEAAEAAHARGLTTVMGAPNVVRGGSHSGNVAALELARADRLDMLSSDYVPASLLHGAFMLHTQAGWSMPRAMATVSSNPAKALGFDDRGELKTGLRADVVRMRVMDGLPIVRNVWVAGQRSF